MRKMISFTFFIFLLVISTSCSNSMPTQVNTNSPIMPENNLNITENNNNYQNNADNSEFQILATKGKFTQTLGNMIQSAKIVNTAAPKAITTVARVGARANGVVAAGVTTYEVGNWISNKISENNQANWNASIAKMNEQQAKLRAQAEARNGCSVPRSASARNSCAKIYGW